ncbi:hypothetical protein GCM10011391_06850 [Pullulanibacillus camelliae]|uniref:DUF2306 domain-containing protein n=1 Tax=Pullulanibacillus camelliae TaxID=1707096 RepID=A0A8J2VNJ3_9BACL|nr:DUF2306 domain-containing protein [Pullulanibacillus camelliae]GGE30857.1 hypothetical protein GCM10011391_06850 [Pullulanibacillus camelliae]
MSKIARKRLYVGLMCFSTLYLLYIVYFNFIYDPQASVFLGHKGDQVHEVRQSLWIAVLHGHILFACLALLSGAYNFFTKQKQAYRMIHRWNGYLYFISVFLVSLSSGYMAPYSTGGRVNSIVFNLINIIWPLFTLIAVIMIRRKQVIDHQRWMIRSYSFCFTNSIIHLLTFISTMLGGSYTLSYTVGVYGALIMNLLIPELVIRYIIHLPRQRNKRVS